MKEELQEFLLANRPTSGKRKKIDIEQMLQDITRACGGVHHFEDQGGYPQLVYLLKESEYEGMISPVKKSPLTHRRPYIRSQYWLQGEDANGRWNPLEVMALRDRLSLAYYERHPEEQTDNTWKAIQSVYTFVKDAESREVIPREERSLELFGDEKFLSEEPGVSLLRNLSLSLQDIKARKNEEPFIYYHVGRNPPRRILIIENLSTFSSWKRLMQQGREWPSFPIDLVIYGEGKKIGKSFAYTQEIGLNGESERFYYFGDLDYEGVSIYVSLKERYPTYRIKLALPLYEEMLRQAQKGYSYTKTQRLSSHALDVFFEEIEQEMEEELAAKAKEFLQQVVRIPQEILNYERMLEGSHHAKVD
ncbi:Wadjet anti-phage system protein JetD domain-containing protein [Brevibacillus brevis]|uniref:Wadjet anti-phage system protein JetD domain-containing protein n=1 Tax=Brevibacillus brevis TaxID=1393 RepID=UPI0037CAC78C